MTYPVRHISIATRRPDMSEEEYGTDAKTTPGDLQKLTTLLDL